MSLGQRLYHFLIRFLPSEFRGDFGDAMLADAARVDRAGRPIGPIRSRGFWWREIGGLIAAIAREHADALRQDVKYSCRLMRRTPGFTSLAVLMLAIGTGANVAMFSVIDAVMLKSPFADSGRVALVLFDRDGKEPTAGIPNDRYQQLAANPGVFSAVAALDGSDSHLLTGAGDPRELSIECVSSSMFDVLGASPAIGRTFTADEDRAGAPPTIVLSDRMWHELGANPAIIGTTLTVNARPVTVLGIMPPAFGGPHVRARTDGWMPLDAPASGRGSRGCEHSEMVNAFARVRPPYSIRDAAGTVSGFTFTSLMEQSYSEYRTPFMALSAAVVFVLLIACANVGGLQLERTIARERELAVRTALGASRGRLIRLMLTEHVILALTGASAGVLATRLSLGGLTSLLPPNMLRLQHLAIDTRALAAATGVAAACAILSGLAPLLHFGNKNRPHASSGSRSVTRGASVSRRALAVGQIALSVIVLIGAGLMVRTFLTLRPVNTGFVATEKLITRVSLPDRTPADAERFFGELITELRSVSGVERATTATFLPMSGTMSMTRLALDSGTTQAASNSVMPDYFTTMRIAMLEGRSFSNDDRAQSDPVVIVNAALANKIRPGGHVVGTLLPVADPRSGAAPPISRRIVGVIANVRSGGSTLRSQQELYLPYAQTRFNRAWLIVSTAPGVSSDEIGAAIKSAERRLAPDLAIAPVTAMSDMLDNTVVRQRFGAWLLGLFGAMALVLAAIGLASMLGWRVRQRTREIGVRLALGATRGRVTALIAREGLQLSVIGIGAGALIAAGLTRYMSSWLYGVTPLDPLTFGATAFGMLVVALLAVFAPAQRAARVDPATTLRQE